jgi:porin
MFKKNIGCLLAAIFINVGAADNNSNKLLSDVSSNAAAVTIVTGTGALGKWLQLPEDRGMRLGGLWIGDTDALCHGGISTPPPKRFAGVNLLVLDFSIDMEKFCGIKNGSFGTQFLRLDGQNVNLYAGAAQGYNSLVDPPPLHRSELYQLWYRQTFIDNKLTIRVGKSVPTYDFNNVISPIVTSNQAVAIPAITGLIYTPIFINSAMIGVLPGYYNSAWGITITVTPIKTLYFSYGLFDGNLARGIQTGIRVGPTINEYSFQIAEGGYSWELGEQKKPGRFALGGWCQTGKLSTTTGITEQGACGVYFFGTQRLWFKNPSIDKSGISAFYQFGATHSITLPFIKYLGLGLTAFSLVPKRPDDSFGIGMALAWLNKRTFTRHTECMLQAYYQLKFIESSYLESALTYIPHPALPNSRPNTVTFTTRIIAFF